MNRNELIDAVTNRTGSTRTVVEATVNAALETIQETVAKGEKVAISGFGAFEKADRKAREARNPATGATIQVGAKSVPKFSAFETFRNRVAAGS